MGSVQRFAALGLAVAAMSIVALAYLVLSDLARESELHHASIDAQKVKDSLENLRLELAEVRSAARLAALTGDARALETIETRAADMDTEIGFLRARAAGDAVLPTFDALAQATRLLVTHARSIGALRKSRGIDAALAAAGDAERLASEATAALATSLSAQTERIDERTAARLRVGDSLRAYVKWFVGGSIAALVALFAGFRRVRTRERAALERAEYLAHFDLVTGLPNRALLADRLAQETARARRAEQRFAVVMFDLDGFKSVNDTWGHAAGDRVLAMAAERARKCMRASDTVGRLGGDEFLAILPEATQEGAFGVAEKLREALGAPYPLDKAVAHVGVSLGVSLFPENGTDPESLQRAADAALYAAKREGKNRAKMAGGAVARAPRPTAEDPVG